MRQGQCWRLANVLLEVIFPQAAIVVIIMTTRIAARGKRHSSVTGTFGSDVGVTFDAKVDRHRITFAMRAVGPMLGMARYAKSGVDFRELRRITRIVELRFGM
jgi:hypothetical protein